MKKKYHWLGIFGTALFGLSSLSAEDNKICPIMIDSEVDSTEVAEFEGTKVLMCCGKCTKSWDKNPKYYIKLALEKDLLPQFKGKEAALGLDKIELMPQRFCPINQKTFVIPESPTVEYKGVKIYLFNAKAVEKWNADPDAAAAAAKKAGLLPQLDGKS